MLKKIYKIIGIMVLAIIVSTSFGFSSTASAIVTPTVQATYTGSGDTVSLNITGDPNSTVYLNYMNTSSTATQTSSIGTTNSSGNFSGTISTGTYGISPGSTYDVVVNGVHSISGTWPYGTTSGSASITFSPTSVSLGLGQQAIVNVINTSSGSLYISGNSSSSIASATISGTQLSITGNAYGSTVLTVCSTTNSSMCSPITVNVSSNGSSGNLSFYPSNPTVSYQQSLPITIGGGTGSYTITNNSNPSAVTANITGSTLYVYGVGTTGGTSNLTICSTNTTACSIVTVSAGNSSGITLGQTSINLTPGQTYSIPITGNGAYTISSNVNSGIASASLSGSSLVGTALANGSTTITVCQSTSACTPFTINVTGTQPNSAVQVTYNIPRGQTMMFTLSGGSGSYTVSNSSSSAVSASVSGNVLSLSGIAQGQSQLNVCATSGGCTAININVMSSVVTPPLGTGHVFVSLLRYGSRGAEVSALQQKLISLGLLSGSDDGYFGPMTDIAVKQYQASKGLTPDGVVGAMTRAALNSN